MRTYARFAAVGSIAAALLAPAAPASANACYVGSEDPVLWACGVVLYNACWAVQQTQVAECLPMG